MKTEMIERCEELSSALIDLRRFESVMDRGEPPVVATEVSEMPGCYVHVSDKEFCDRVLALARERIEEIVNEMQKRMKIPLNPEPDGTCRTIKANYYKVSQGNFIRGGGCGATGVICDAEEVQELGGDVRREKDTDSGGGNG